jgi:hypothetical protein
MTHTQGLETRGRRPGVPEAVNEVCSEWSKKGRRKMQEHYTVSLGLHRFPKTSKRSPKSLRYGEWANRPLPGPLSSHQETSKRLQKTSGHYTLVKQTEYLKEPKANMKPVSWQLISSSHLQPKQVSPSLAYWLVDSLKRVSIQRLESYQVSPWGT